MRSESATSTKSGIKKVSTNCNLCGADDFVQLTIGLEHEYDNTTNDTFNVVRCNQCALVYLNPRPDVATLSTIYPPNYYSYNQKSLRDSANPNSILQRLRYKGFQAKVQTSVKLACQFDQSTSSAERSTSHANKSISPDVESTSRADGAISPGVESVSRADGAISPGVESKSRADGAISPGVESTSRTDPAISPDIESTSRANKSTSPDIESTSAADREISVANESTSDAGSICLAGSTSHSTRAISPIRVLDIGCGDGHTLDLYRKHPGVETYGVDFNSGAIALAKQNGHVVTVGRFEDVDLQPDFFDLVTATHVIEHVPDPADFMRKAFAVLKPGGIFWLETPNVESLDARLFREKHWGGYHFPRHWFFFSKRTMLSLAEKIGFQTVVVDFVPNAIFWFWTMHSILLDKFPQARKTIDALFPPIDFQKDSWANFLRICFFCSIDIAIKAVSGETSNMIVALRKPKR